MATLAPPDLLLLDEHTASLDPANGAAITRMTGAFIEEAGLTTIMVTHNMEQAIVELFSRRHIADDELLLGVAY